MGDSENCNDEMFIQNLKAPNLTKLVIIVHEAMPTSRCFPWLLFIWSQIQIIFIIIKSILFSFNKQADQSSETPEQVQILLFLEQLLEYDQSTTKYLAILAIIGIYIGLVISMVCWLFIVIYKRCAHCRILNKILGLSIRIHPFICFMAFHLVSLRGLTFYNEEAHKTLKKEKIRSVFALSVAVMILNMIWSLVVIFRFSVNVKDKKGSFSVSTNLLDLIDLGYKFLLPFFWSFPINSQVSEYLMLATHIAFCLLKIFVLFQFIPYYNLTVLNLAKFFNCLFSSLIFAAFFVKIIRYFDFYPGFGALVLSWIFFFLAVYFILTNQIQKLFLKILLYPTEISNPYHLIHYMKIYKSFSRYSASGLAARKVNENYLSYVSAVNQSEVNYLLPSKSLCGWTSQTHKMIDNHFTQKNLELLETYDRKNPKLIILKLTLVRYYIKSERSIVLINHILDECLSYSSIYNNSIYLTKMMTLSKLKKTETQTKKNMSLHIDNEKSNMNVQTYIRLQGMHESIKERIMQQIEFHEQFWKDFQSENPSFLSLQKLAKKIHEKSKFSKKILADSILFFKAGFSDPFLTLGLYFCFVRNDFIQGQKFFSDYWDLKSTNKRQYLTGIPMDESDLISDAFYLVVSTTKNQVGNIISCHGKRAQKELFLGRSINSLMPVLYGECHDYLLRASHKINDLEAIHNKGEVLTLSEDNTLILCKIFLRLRYLMEHGLCFIVVLRPIKRDKRLVLIGDNGLLSNFSKEFALEMGIKPEVGKYYNIFNFCPDLKKIIDGFENPYHKHVKEFLSKFESNKEMCQAAIDSVKNLNPIKTKENRGQNNLSKLINVQTKETNLTFFPKQNNNDQGLCSASKIVYHAEIRKIVIQNTHIIELKMTKVINDDKVPINKPIKSNTNLYGRRSVLFSHSIKSSYEQITQITRTYNSKKTMKVIDFNTQNSENHQLRSIEDYTSSPLHRGNITQSAGSLVSIRESAKELDEGTSQVSKPENQDDYLFENNTKIINLFSTGEEKLPPKDNSIDFKSKRNLLNECKKFNMNLRKELFGDKFLRESMSSKWLEAHDIINRVIESRKQKRLTKNYYLSLIATLIYFFGFLVWLNVYVSTTSKSVEILGQVLKETYFRNCWTNIANQETKIWIGKRKGYFISPIPPTIAGNKAAYESLNQLNQNLRKSITYLEPDLQNQFNLKQVKVYERDSYNNLEFISIDNTFEVTDKIVTKGLKNVNKENPDVLVGESINQETRYIFDNSYNDLLISSNQIANIVRGNLFDQLAKSRDMMRLGLIITLVVLTLFILFSFYFMIVNNKEANIFMEIIFSLSIFEIQKVEKSLGKLRKLIKKGIEGSDSLDFLHFTRFRVSEHDNSNSFRNVKHKRTGFRKASMHKFYIRNYYAFGGLLLNLLLIFGFSFFYYYRAMGKTDIIESQQYSIETTLRFINTVTITSVEIQSIILENNTVTIRNAPVFDALNEDIEAIKSFYNLQDILMNNKGVFSSYQQAIFFNISCENTYSPIYGVARQFIMESCQTKDRGLGHIGLMKILSELVTDLTKLFSDYRAAPVDKAPHDIFYADFFGSVLSSINLSVTLLMLSFTSLTEDFQDLVSELEANRILLGWIAGLVALLLGGMTWMFAAKKLLEREFERNKILSLIPKKLMFSNYRLRMYTAKLATDIGFSLKNLI